MPAKPTHGDRSSIRPIVHRKSIESLPEGKATTIPQKNIKKLSGSIPSAVAAQIHFRDRFFGSSPMPSFSGGTGSSALGVVFGRGTVRHGVLIKHSVNPEVGRYAPPDMIQAERLNVNGISNQATICTSHVERNNLTIRTFMKRFTRLALGFSKKVENLTAATAIHVAVYNFCRIHSTIRCTPAMAAGVIDRLWGMGDLYDAVTEHAADVATKAKRDRRIQRLIDRLQRGE
jgi:IS1 family transposase